jgi:general secretion pathway protein A
MEQIRLLTNLETTKEKLLQIILVGQPELNTLLARHDLRQLAQRITARYDLQPLSWDESCEYVMHRCRVAGAQMPLFSRGALRAVHRRARGIPRVINVICDRALLAAYAAGKSQVSGALVRQSAREIRPAVSAGRRWGLALAASAVGVTLGALLWLWWPAPVGREISTEAPAAEAVASAATHTLETLLADDNVPTDTDTAFARLFAYWQRDYAQFSGDTGCDRALQAGLRCLFESGTWNNLRQLNRPAIIELTDARGGRHHVLVSALNEESVVLELGDRLRELALADVDRFWFGKYLALWSPPEGAPPTLRRGASGSGVRWLREALTRAGLTGAASTSDVFDAELEARVREFQRRHRIEEDGIVGKFTLILLTTYDKIAPPLLAQSNASLVR